MQTTAPSWATMRAVRERRRWRVYAPRDERVERARQVVALAGGEEPDAAEVDAQDGHLGSVQQAGTAQQRAVAAEGDERVERPSASAGTGRCQNGSSRGS